MQCPRCGAQAPSGAAICNSCNEILDPAQFSTFADEVDGDNTDPGDRTEASPQRPAAPARAAAGRPQRPSAPARAAPATTAKKAPPAPARPYLQEAPPELPPDPMEEARRSVDELGAFFRSLSGPDRIAAGASMLAIATLALPWRWTKLDDDIIGLVSAFPAGILAAGTAGLVYVRARRANASLAATLKLLQLGCSLALVVFCAAFFRAVTDERILRGAGRGVTSVISSAQPGAYLGAVFALVALLASAAAALNRQSR